ncbi:hypothetical protein [Novosphingobium sp. TCA1]|uniref:hypothetical protein n=1 Tax=Novosphingobium sp. TCA1 TaxID=2682474 RepID=UPI0013588749|nr:hypothetical protein [Novosphingobium sp. TCA1]
MPETVTTFDAVERSINLFSSALTLGHDMSDPLQWIACVMALPALIILLVYLQSILTPPAGANTHSDSEDKSS